MVLTLLLLTRWNIEMQRTDVSQFTFHHFCSLLALGHLNQLFSFHTLHDVANLGS